MANEKRLIDANALNDSKWWESLTDDFDKARARIIVMSAPTVDAVEVVHGRWITSATTWGEKAICSVCGRDLYVNEPGNGLLNIEDLHYCPNCGAKMDRERREGE